MIEPGQIYYAANGSGRRIRVLQQVTPGVIHVETIQPNGTGGNARNLGAGMLHDGDSRTGYILDPDSNHVTPETQ